MKSEHHFNLEAFLPYRLAVTTEIISQKFASIYRKDYGLSRAEWRILCHLSQAEKPLSIRDLQQRAHLEKSKTSRAVAKMEKKALVQKKIDPTDTRLLEIELTTAGYALLSEIAPKAEAFQTSLLTPLGKDKASALWNLLETLAEFDRE